jgi:hypothetical protein
MESTALVLNSLIVIVVLILVVLLVQEPAAVGRDPV